VSRADAVAPNALLGGKLLLRQPETGHRVGTDAILLAAAAPPGRRAVVDLGCGVGAVGLAVARAHPESRVLLVDNDDRALALARDNIMLNGLEGRVSALRADALAPAAERRAAGLAPASADLALTNPPFGAAERMRASPDPARAAAHVMPAGGLARWLACAADLLGPKGVLVLIHRADALAEILAAMGERLGSVAVTPVHPRADAPATRILLRATKGGKAPLALLPALVLHGPDGRFTPEAEAIHRGEAMLACAGVQ